MSLTELLAEVKALDEKATKGPWDEGRSFNPYTLYADVAKDRIGQFEKLEDLRFARYARTLLPKLARVVGYLYDAYYGAMLSEYETKANPPEKIKTEIDEEIQAILGEE